MNNPERLIQDLVNTDTHQHMSDTTIEIEPAYWSVYGKIYWRFLASLAGLFHIADP